MGGEQCFICKSHLHYDAETTITVERTERDYTKVQTTVWVCVVCDKCLKEHFGIVGVFNEQD